MVSAMVCLSPSLTHNPPSSAHGSCSVSTLQRRVFLAFQHHPCCLQKTGTTSEAGSTAHSRSDGNGEREGSTSTAAVISDAGVDRLLLVVPASAAAGSGPSIDAQAMDDAISACEQDMQMHSEVIWPHLDPRKVENLSCLSLQWLQHHLESHMHTARKHERPHVHAHACMHAHIQQDLTGCPLLADTQHSF